MNMTPNMNKPGQQPTAVTSSKGWSTAWYRVNSRPKYPILLESLVNRIKAVASLLGSRVSLNLRSWPATKEGRLQMKQALSKQGGIYIWWCRATGLFYIGSAMRFFGRDGRLAAYWQGSDLNPESGTINKSLAADILKYGHDSFVVLVLQTHAVGSLTSVDLFSLEQLWMLVLPTYNSTYRVGAVGNSNQMTEEHRANISTTVHVYEVDNRGSHLVNGQSSIMPGSHQVIAGVRQLVRSGITTMGGMVISLSAFTVQAILISATLYANALLITKTAIPNTSVWAPTLYMQYAALSADNHSAKRKTVWVYRYNSDPNHRYTEHDLVDRHDSLSKAMEKYKVATTTYQRMRQYLLPLNGLIHSNVPLHRIL